ncbi:unnamed protein product [Allacma fusca]|uniref:Uncharacterized protein n=1 Tax=Allacma fusca TaxID=39272 RepID=A0A8J2NJP3_9HEXA|nr:unnamed protein product [Allacma fusca]
MNFRISLACLVIFYTSKFTVSLAPLQGTSSFGRHDPNKIRLGDTIVDLSNKFVQNSMGASTTYSLYTEQNSMPLYTRHIQDRGRHFVLFPDNKYPRGSGHYIVMRKFKYSGLRGPQRNQIYEAFDLFLEKSTRALVFNWPKVGAGSEGRAKPLDDNKDEEKVDVGEVVGRSKRKTVSNAHEIPQFSTIKVTFSSNEMEVASREDLAIDDYSISSAPSEVRLMSSTTFGEPDKQKNSEVSDTTRGQEFLNSRMPDRPNFDESLSPYNVEPEE